MEMRLNKVFKNYFSSFLFLFILEVLFRILSGYTIFNLSLIRVIILINIMSLFLGYFVSLFSRKVGSIINLCIKLFFAIYAWLQLGFNNFLGVYISFNTSSQLGAVSEYIKDFLKSLKMSYYIIFMPFLLFFIIYIIKRVFDNKFDFKSDIKLRKNNKVLTNCIFVVMLVVSSILFVVSLDDRYMSDEFQVVSNKDLFLSASNPSLCVKEFGITPFSLIDAKSKFYKYEVNSELYLAFGGSRKSETRKYDDTNWNTLIEEETNSTFNSLNNYFINQDITEVNEYTGMFKDKNLIIVMMESVNDVILKESDYYPNFKKLASEGWYFENNYSPRNSCATGNNEFSAMTSLYSIYNNCTVNVFKENDYFEAVFNRFSSSGYTTNSFHNFTEGYYFRRTIHPNMGSEAYYGIEDMGVEYSTKYGTWTSDEDLMNYYLHKIDELNTDKPFMSYITTVSSHQPYYDSLYGDLHFDMTEGTGYSDELRHYMSKLKVLDNALGILVDGLDERNLLDDTVIVLFGDHYPYGIPLDILNESLDRSLENFENEKVPFVIYNPKLEEKVFDTYTSYINLLPTLANMFDLEYDPRLYMGTDIFDKEYNNTVVFADSSWKNDKAFYNATTGDIEYFTDDVYTNDEILAINKKIYAKMNASEKAIRNNYFSYLNKKLKEIEEREN